MTKGEDKAICKLRAIQLEEVRMAIFGDGSDSNPGIKYKQVETNTLITGLKSKMTLMLWFNGFTLAALAGGVIKIYFT